MIRGFENNKRAALLISECQRGVISPAMTPFKGLGEEVERRGILDKISTLADAFRAAGLPVIHLHVVHRKGYIDLPRTSVIIARSMKENRMLEGTAEVESVDEVAPKGDDIVHARSFSLVAFHGTELDSMLRNMGVTTLVPVGVSTNVAISGASLCGSDLGYQVVVPEDCIAGATQESHEFIVQNLLPLYATLSESQTIMQTLAERG
ncbi:cysteine hydrolase [Stutzerimonas xanthomarina]|jgi:nicotinamidase-related amidase|uniref:Cysteine hydrolase n=1 Tax=Stutzerimonas xanthomarina TaxID=271420 RepID=A0A427EB62_9GAMM|nr:isochorismatase family cysteine hydrolase [Stutzerimonas xanthomarina]MCW8158391.1 cysteine hydrolase [Stutzerimonas stutzeri]RRV13454.1 cysteine hydrolase [Stutzerimonas xanthomarina]